MRCNVIIYLVGEGIKNVLKNKKSTVASLGIMICTMFMFGLFFIIGENINNLMTRVQEEQGIQAYLEESIKGDKIEEVRKEIASIDGVSSAVVVTKQDALDIMKNKLAKHPELMEPYEGDNNIFPDSILVNLNDLKKSAEVQEKISKIELDGEKVINDIRSSDKTINALIKIANGIRIATGVILVLLIAISVFIISNTIKLTVHSRRKEISIMKYVGATNSFIRWPFIVEGIIIGIIAGAISMLIVGSLYNLAIQKILESTVISAMSLTLVSFADMFNLIGLVYLLLGTGIGVLGSSISMRKYLKV